MPTQHVDGAPHQLIHDEVIEPRDLMDAVQAVGQDEVAGGTRQSGAKLKTYGIGAQILRDLGVSRMRVLSAPKQMHGLSGFDLEVVEYVAG